MHCTSNLLVRKKKKNEPNNWKRNILIPFIVLSTRPTSTPGPKRNQLVTLHINYDLLKRHEGWWVCWALHTEYIHTCTFFCVVVSIFSMVQISTITKYMVPLLVHLEQNPSLVHYKGKIKQQVPKSCWLQASFLHIFPIYYLHWATWLLYNSSFVPGV